MTIPETLFRPRSIAIVGASADASKLSSIPLRNLLRAGYGGRIYPVNPREQAIDGMACYPDIASLPEVPDVAFLVVPGDIAVRAATECAVRGTTAAIVASTGFAEAGEEGQRRQAALVDLRGRHGMRLVGPNTNGIYSAHDRLSLGYNAAHAEVFLPGEVSVVSHSGALFSTIGELLRSHGMGIGKFVAVGNEADLDMLDFLEHMVDDAESRTILLILEAVRDGARLRALAARARAAGKRIAALKLGTSAAGAASTAAHSSRMAGNARAYRALFEGSGIGVLDSLESLVLFARLAHCAASDWQPRTFDLGVVTASGAGGTLMADAASRSGFGIATLESATQVALQAHNAEAAVFNPLDVASFGSSRNTPVTAPLLGADAAVQAVVAFVHKLQTPTQRESYARGLVASLKATGKPHMAIAPADLPEDQAAQLRDGGVALVSQTGAAFTALRALFDSSMPHAEAGLETVDPMVSLTGTPEVLDEVASMAVLDAADIPTVARGTVGDAEAAVEFGRRNGWPIVLKGVVEGVAHKSDAGLVHLDIADPAHAMKAYATIEQVMRDMAPEGSATGVVAQAMVRGGLETLVGMTSEPALGRFLIAGLGGRQAEYIDDVLLWCMPVSRERVRADLLQASVGRILTGGRWSRDGALDELVDVLMKLQTSMCTAAGRGVQAVEINPLSLTADGPIALDALVIRDGATKDRTREKP